MILHLNDIRAQYAPSVSLLRFQFCRPPRGLPSFQQSLNGVAQLVDQEVVVEILIDLGGLPDVSLDQQLWVAAKWLPQLSMSAMRHVAFVIPPNSIYNQMVVETLHRAARHFIWCEVQFFNNPVEGLDWLLSFQDPAAQAALEHEWTAAGPLPAQAPLGKLF